MEGNGCGHTTGVGNTFLEQAVRVEVGRDDHIGPVVNANIPFGFAQGNDRKKGKTEAGWIDVNSVEHPWRSGSALKRRSSKGNHERAWSSQKAIALFGTGNQACSVAGEEPTPVSGNELIDSVQYKRWAERTKNC
jgi:hypothetical protein